jgi:hypothetical protein
MPPAYSIVRYKKFKDIPMSDTPFGELTPSDEADLAVRETDYFGLRPDAPERDHALYALTYQQATSALKQEVVKPRKLKELLIELTLDNWTARATTKSLEEASVEVPEASVAYHLGKGRPGNMPAATDIGNGILLFNNLDGFYHIPFDEVSPLPAETNIQRHELAGRRRVLDQFLRNQENATLVNISIDDLHREIREQCSSE